jgi:nicotinate-nucleotide adenylyltransferase
MSSTLCFGGSFNPIHNGHTICARTVAQELDFDRVLLIPSARPPHKSANADLAGAEDRLAMCHIVAAEEPLFHVTDLEIHRSGPSYTIDTAHELKRDGRTTIHWLIGADMLNYLPKWHKSLQLIQEINFVVMARPGFTFEWDSLPEPFQKLRGHVVEAPLVEVSATEIRDRVRRGESIEGLVSAGIAEYIREQHLYR